MRVTKAVREYIEKQVRAKIEKKYEAEKNESKRIKDIKEDIENLCDEVYEFDGGKVSRISN